MKWQRDGHNFIYELSSQGINKWWAQVSAGYGDDGQRPGSGEIEEVTTLMFAAPDLLEALQAITALYNTDEGCRTLPEYTNAVAAIAKATDKQI